MKKSFISFLVFALMLTSVEGWAKQVTVEDAAAIAARFTNEQPQLRRAHQAPRQAANMRLAHKALQNNSQDAAFYVFNQEGDKGFVIVSADDRTAEEVLAYSENGSFDYATINPNLRWWLSRYAEEITVLQTIDDSEFIDNGVRKAKQVTAIDNLLKNRNGVEITWYQETPYNNLCPMDNYDNTRCLTGCVATAASQIMYKWEWPKKGTGSKTYTWENPNKTSQSVTMTADYANTTYAWDDMLPAYIGKNYSDAQAKAVATLMWHAGISCEMGYGGNKAGGSGAWTDEMAYGLMTYFGYKFDKFITMYSKSNYGTAAVSQAEYSVTRAKFIEYFNTDLEAGRPILMGGEDTSGEGGHEFVCCGRDANNKFYINWGWEGEGNCYVELSSLKPTGTSYNFSNNLDALIGLEPDIQDLPKVTITWSVDGVETEQEFTQEDPLVLPENPANCESGKVFVGWTESSSVDGSKPADLFTTAKGKTVTEAVTYYAVFADAEEGEGGGSNEVTFTAGTDTSDELTITKEGVTITLTSGTLSRTDNYRCYANNSMTVEATSNITKIILNCNANGTTKGGPGCFTADGYSYENKVGTWTGEASSVVFTAGQQVQINSMTVTLAGGGITYSDYSLNCGAACEGELTDITLNTTNVKKEFTEGEEFSYAGLVVTAHYDGCADKTVIPTSVSADMSKIGKQDVTVTYEDKNATYEITITALPTYAIRFYNNGVQVGETQNVKAGQVATKPATDPEACEGYTFVGWYTEALAEDNTEKPTVVTDFTATKDQDYLAVYSQTEVNSVSRRAKAEEATLWAEDFSGYSAGDVPSGEVDDSHSGTTVYNGGSVTYSVENGGGTTKVYNETLAQGTAPELLIAKSGGSFSIEGIPTGGASELTLTFNTNKTSGLSVSSATSGVTVGSISIASNVATCTITCSGVESLDLTITNSPNANSREDNFLLVGEAGGSGPSSTTYYTTAPNCGAPVECELTSIALNTDNVEKNFLTGSEFSAEGLVVTASYSNCNNKTVTPTSISTPDMSAAGEKTVTVSYSENDITKEASYTIQVNDPELFIIGFYNNGALIGDEQLVEEGQQPDMPADPEAACNDYTFFGWFTAPLAADNTVKPAVITDFTATQDQDYYAIFTKTEEGEDGSAEFDDEVGGSYKIFAQVGDIKYYATGLGTNNKLTSSTDEAEAVDFVFGKTTDGFTISLGGSYLSYGGSGTNVSLSANEYIWSVDAGEHGTWRINSGTTNRALIFRAGGYNVFGVYSTGNVNGTEYFDLEIGAAGASSTTYYTSLINCEGTGVENVLQAVSAQKALRNGQIVIIRGEAVYTITGTRIQ